MLIKKVKQIKYKEKIMKKKIVAKDKSHLIELIQKEMEFLGNECDLNHIDVSQWTDMFYLFNGSKFNGDISQWDVSNVQDMNNIFADSQLQKENKLPYWHLPTKEERVHVYLQYHIQKEKNYIENFLNLSQLHDVDKKIKSNKI